MGAERWLLRSLVAAPSCLQPYPNGWPDAESGVPVSMRNVRLIPMTKVPDLVPVSHSAIRLAGYGTDVMRITVRCDSGVEIMRASSAYTAFRSSVRVKDGISWSKQTTNRPAGANPPIFISNVREELSGCYLAAATRPHVCWNPQIMPR
ncbi:hypothetical protein EJ06DRAFT_523544 [Trichodelitschia bisporula]|uniref:Uncharacterized protein n=1 Tax=Trichodelitschia bisporula TaxID=703511 RepID=A0A6G1HQL9_9PEZI|nr:hypothetical protein EJ06DRAFT_523544 [Trichodelitschia bisporula]